MITYINTKNRDKYQVLFTKAQQALKEADPSKLSGIDVDKVEIYTLNQYFAYLKDLISIASNENIKSYFLRLPLDEEFFEINTNNREITIPRSFTSNGVGVQGDETAEIVYFSVDRYFDHMDLANDDMYIVIQWETKDKNKETITGISPNFGKDIETIPGKIIFGWPIYSELTESATPIKFSVRFFSFGETNDDGVKTLNYSLSTLPATVLVGATLDYDMVNRAAQEIEKGNNLNQRIINNINNAGIYDPSVPIPSLPTISTALHISGQDPDVRVADLPQSGDITLKISAHPTDDASAVQYTWRKYNYDSVAGDFSDAPIELTSGINDDVYEEVTTTLGDDLYYKIETINGVTSFVPILKESLASIDYNSDNQGFELADNSTFIKIYKRYCTADINEVGIYTVLTGARNGVNTVTQKYNTSAEEKSTGITVPGPLKPTIELPEGTNEEDEYIHVLVQNNAVTLSTKAQPTEKILDPDSNAKVDLTYNWKKLENGAYTNVIAEVPTMPVSVLPVQQLSTDSAWLENAADDTTPGGKGIYNQEHVQIVQDGNNVVIYLKDTDNLKAYESTDSSQGGEHEWIALDIDTGKENLEGTSWQDGQYIFTSEDENELGIANGHILFWFKADETSVERKIDDTTLTFTVSTEAPSLNDYSFITADKSSILIQNLADSGVDEIYVTEVTAERNKVKTSKDSKKYRITNAPEKPVIKRFFNNHWAIADYTTEQNLLPFNMKRNNQYKTLYLSVDQPQQSDNLSYIWMRLRAEDNISTDWENDSAKLQVDLDNFLSDLFEDKPGLADIPVDGVFGLTALSNLGEVVDSNETGNGPALEFSDNTPTGIYYCIVINELNNYRVANVSPFYSVTNN